VETEQTFGRRNDDQLNYEVTILRYIPEYLMVVAATNRKNVILWRYHYSACAITLKHGAGVCALAYCTCTHSVIQTGNYNFETKKLRIKQE
jgi:hypothetical protein